MKVTVVGLGKIGLPLAVQCAGSGAHVVGADISERVVDAVRSGRPHFPGEPDLARRLAQVLAEGRLEASTDVTASVSASDVVIVVVPLYADPTGWIDFATIDAATDAVGAGLRPGTLVIYETTVPVGTTRSRFGPRLAAASGLGEGVGGGLGEGVGKGGRLGEGPGEGSEFGLAFSPERVSSGRVFADLGRYPKLVGGINPDSARRAAAFYTDMLDFEPRTDLGRPNGVWDLGTVEAAEFAKLAETTYRDVNIALANQFARYAERIGVDFGEVAEACNSQPYSRLHRPGIAVGGHCIPVYPWFYLAGDPDATIVHASRQYNATMPEHAVDLLERAYGSLSGSTVVVLGASYRGGVKETACSGVFPTVAALHRRGARALVHDPLYTPPELGTLALTPYRAGTPVHAAILQADHPEYRTFGPTQLPGVTVILDGRGVLTPDRWPGVRLLTIGGGHPT